jgi:hypothetical protein
MRIVVLYLLYTVAALMVAAVAFSALLVAVVGWALRDDDAAQPVPVVRLTPPASRRARLHARLTICRRQGHTFRLAFPVGRLSQQCTRCGAQAPRLVVKSFRTERA